jgi:hypothetical protein
MENSYGLEDYALSALSGASSGLNLASSINGLRGVSGAGTGAGTTASQNWDMGLGEYGPAAPTLEDNPLGFMPTKYSSLPVSQINGWDLGNSFLQNSWTNPVFSGAANNYGAGAFGGKKPYDFSSLWPYWNAWGD